MKRLAIIGSGDLGQQIAFHALNDDHYIPVGFFDDNISKKEKVMGLEILGGTNDVETCFKMDRFDVIMIGIGYKHFDLRASFFELFYTKIPFGTIIHSSSYVDKSCNIGEGVIIYPGCILDMNVTIKNNVLLNVGCVIAHDSVIGDHSFLSPTVKIAGFVNVGKKVNLGIGSVVIDNINIAESVKTGGGAVVINDLKASGLYVGVPAAFKKGNLN